VALTTLVLPAVLRWCTDQLRCDSLLPDFPPVLHSEPELPCWGPAYTGLASAAVAVLVITVLGVSSCLALLLWLARRAGTLGSERTLTVLGLLYQGFRWEDPVAEHVDAPSGPGVSPGDARSSEDRVPGACERLEGAWGWAFHRSNVLLWHPTVILPRVAALALALASSSSPQLQAPPALAILLGSLLLHAHVQPYEDTGLNLLAGCALALQTATVAVAAGTPPSVSIGGSAAPPRVSPLARLLLDTTVPGQTEPPGTVSIALVVAQYLFLLVAVATVLTSTASLEGDRMRRRRRVEDRAERMEAAAEESERRAERVDAGTDTTEAAAELEEAAREEASAPTLSVQISPPTEAGVVWHTAVGHAEAEPRES